MKDGEKRTADEKYDARVIDIIGHTTITVEGWKYDVYAIEPTESPKCRGHVIFSSRKIFLLAGLAYHMKQSLSHEVTHILLDNRGLHFECSLEQETICEWFSDMSRAFNYESHVSNPVARLRTHMKIGKKVKCSKLLMAFLAHNFLKPY